MDDDRTSGTAGGSAAAAASDLEAVDGGERGRQLRRTLEGLIGIPATEGNRIEVLHNGDQIFPAMLEAIRDAQRSIDLLTFVYWRGDIAQDFAEALADRAAAGVRVRVLLDAVGARLIDDELVDNMQEAGCDLRWFRPVAKGELGEVNHRTHRKVLVCDERGGVHGRRRDRRRVARRRARRDRVA